METNFDLKTFADTLKTELGINQRETLNLTKNSRGYNWDVKIFWGTDDEKTIERMATINSKMEERFGIEE